MKFEQIFNTTGLPFEQAVSENISAEIQWHPEFIISFVLEGNFSLNFHSQKRQLAAHDFYFFKPFEDFCIMNASADTRLLTFYVNYGFMKLLCPEITSIYLNTWHLPCNENSDIYKKLCANTAKIIFNTMKNDTCSRFKLLEAIASMITTLLETYGTRHSENLKTESYSQERVLQILNYINENYMHKISLNEISGHLGIHPQYFSTFFNKQFHSSFTDYLTKVRINQSIRDLRYTDSSILDIAVSYGFNNHKTYSAAFKKLYQVSPTEFRKSHLNESRKAASENTPSEIDDLGVFSYFQNYLNQDNSTFSAPHNLQTHQSLSFDLLNPAKSIQNLSQAKFVAIGRAYACLRNEIQTQIREAKADFDFDYLRLRDIFSDDLFVYYEDDDKNPVFRWQSLFTIFDFLLSINVKPFPEIGFMPRMLASKKQYAGWQYHPNVSFPKSLDKWAMMISSFIRGCVDRYGRNEVRSWYFDFWTCPDLQIKNGYWNETQEKFFQFYKVTYQAMKKVDPEIRLGSPNFSDITGFPWYENFFEFCLSNKISPAFLSSHSYGCEFIAPGNKFLELSDSPNAGFRFCDINKLHNDMEILQSILKKKGFEALKIIVSDWNITYLPKDLVRDTCFMGPYIAHSVIHTLGQVHGLCLWSLSDIHEEFFPEELLFRGGPGMMDEHGLKKASYNTFDLIYKLGQTILDKGENYILTKKEDKYLLLVFNYISFDGLYSRADNSALSYTQRYNIYEKNEDLVIQIMMKLPAASYYIKQYEVNRQFGSAYDLWVQMGAPKTLHKEQEDYLRERSVPGVTYVLREVMNSLLFDVTIPPHGVTLLEISPTQS